MLHCGTWNLYFDAPPGFCYTRNDITRDGDAGGVPLQKENWKLLTLHSDFAILGMILLGTEVQGVPPCKRYNFSTLEVFYSDCYTRTVGLHYSDNLGWDYVLYVLFILLSQPPSFWKNVAGGTIAVGVVCQSVCPTQISATRRWNWMKFGIQYSYRYISGCFFCFSKSNAVFDLRGKNLCFLAFSGYNWLVKTNLWTNFKTMHIIGFPIKFPTFFNLTL